MKDRTEQSRPAANKPAHNKPAQSGGARRLALDALERIDRGGAYANVLLRNLLDRSKLSPQDRRFVTELVYGTTRMQRACDWLVDRFLLGEVEAPVRAALRMGAYQLVFLGTPPHAAVAETVEAVRGPARKLVNAVLRKVADAGVPEVWPTESIRLSYPDWIVRTLTDDLGATDTAAALAMMNEPATVSERDDGYIQDPASQWIVQLCDAAPGQRIVDLCAAPGGKATGLAAAGAQVVAVDLKASRVGLLARNVAKLQADRVTVLCADAAEPPLKAGSFDRVLLDAPCSGLGSLRRRPDARWQLDEAAPARLAKLQQRLLRAAADLVAPGGTLIYSVCTMSRIETLDVLDHVDLGGFDPLVAPGAPWRPHGPGALLLPQAAGSDGMFIYRARRRA